MTSVPDAQEKNHKVTVDTTHVDVAIVTNFFFLKNSLNNGRVMHHGKNI